MFYDVKAFLEARLPQLQKAHRKRPDAIVLVSDFSQLEDREGAIKIDPYLAEEVLAHSASKGLGFFLRTIPFSDLMDADEDRVFIESIPAGHFGMIMLCEDEEPYRLYFPE